jgi:very-short-patch-repair endonuclease
MSAAAPRPAAALLTALLDYILEQARDVDPRGFDLSNAKDFVAPRAAIARLPGVSLNVATDAGGDPAWMRVERLQAIHPPLPGASDDAGLLRIPQDPDGAGPALEPQALARRVEAAVAAAAPGSPVDRAALEAGLRARAESLLAAYRPTWSAWAGTERPRRRTIGLYAELFALMQRLQQDATANPSELVWGIGVATWRLERDGGPVGFHYPMITQQLEIAVDDASLAIELRPRLARPRLEIDALVACGVTAAVAAEQTVRARWDGSDATLPTPFDAGSHAPVLQLLAGNLQAEGRYVEVRETDATAPAPSGHLVVTDDWALLARPQRTNFLKDDIERLKRHLAEQPDVPEGPAALVTPAPDAPIGGSSLTFRGLSSGGAPSGDGHRELFFPLPYNDEQVAIVRQLERAPGVTVQGPPGTGKTHTIANIVCHWLATGRRVLVTSAGEPALRVLQDKIPEAVRPLTVALLAGDREGMKQFETSIRAIREGVTQLDESAIREAIDRALQSIDRAHAELHAIDRRFDAIAAAQLDETALDGRPMRAAEMAARLIAGRERHAWFTDSPPFGPEGAPPLTGEEGARLRAARRALGPDLVYVGCALPAADGFAPPSQVAALHATLLRIRALDDEAAASGAAPLRRDDEATRTAARGLLERVEQARALALELEAVDGGWAVGLRAKCRAPAFAAERNALLALFDELDALAVEREGFLKRPVEAPAEALGCGRTREAVERAARTGRPFGLLPFGGGPARDHVPRIRVAALAPRAADDWAHVARWFALHDRVAGVAVRWRALADALDLPPFDGGVGALRSLEAAGRAARIACRLATEFDAQLPAAARDVLAGADESDFAGASAALARAGRMLALHLSRADLRAATLARDDLRARAGSLPGPVGERLRALVDTLLGDERVGPDDAAAAYGRVLAELRRLADLAAPLALVSDACARIEAAGAAAFARRLRTEPAPATGDDPLLPDDWHDAWQHGRLAAHLDAIESRAELLELTARRSEVEARLAQLYREAVSQSAWLSTRRNATGAVMAALNGYATAMRRLGKGTGPNAARYRRDAREAMLEAAEAVPCWIMSHARVSETLPARIGAFDLVIVDEASQSNLWSLPAILRARQVLIVGDDRQVSPTGGFIDATRIGELRARFLADQPHGVDMTPEKSLYDLAARVFAAHQVMLREHFRCVEPIIAYSNHAFYGGRILPLRVPRASERIDPPLVDLYVPHGVRGRNDVNDGEARAIADEIAAMIADPRFAGRTIGVVTLLGGLAHARHVDATVRARCDPLELMRRRFAVGDAPTFQGSERDVMFLSLVVDRDNCHASAGLAFEQRFNVAASRARDRMVLVRSVRMDELSPNDALRRELLAHFESPRVAERLQPTELSERCESGFEREVFDALVARGYRVLPQVTAGAYRIDLVVEGAADRRLAIECDGDAFHGPAHWENDIRRQRVLERAGWTFWRCFASTWTLRRDEVLAELLARLAAMGIQPEGPAGFAPRIVERRVAAAPRGAVQSADPGAPGSAVDGAAAAAISEGPAAGTATVGGSAQA